MSEYMYIFADGSDRNLSVAVQLIDDFTGKDAKGKVAVSLEGLQKTSVKNPSGYYLYYDLPEDTYTIKVDGGSHFFDQEAEVDLAKHDSEDPVIITLTPAPAYPFPASATLIRGVIKDKQGKPSAGVKLNVYYTTIKTKTSEKGEYAIYFKDLTKKEIKVKDEKRIVQFKNKNVAVKAKIGRKRSRKKTVEVEEGKTASLSFTYP